MKKYEKLVTLGCSLAPKSSSWPEYVAEYLQIDYNNWTHYGFGGGGNQILLSLWHEYFLNNDLSDTLVIWEITGLNRHSGVFKFSSQEKMALRDDKKWDHDNSGWWHKINTFYDDKERYVLFNNFCDFEPFNQFNIDAQTLYAQLTSTLCTIPCDTVIFRGWSGAVYDAKWNKSVPVFEKYNKTVIAEPYVDWVIERDLPMQEDGVHPRPAGAQGYFDNVMKLYLDKL